MLEQDRKAPEHCWNAGISKYICEAWTGVIPGTFSVDLLSSTEFLLYKLPKMGSQPVYDLPQATIAKAHMVKAKN